MESDLSAKVRIFHEITAILPPKSSSSPSEALERLSFAIDVEAYVLALGREGAHVVIFDYNGNSLRRRTVDCEFTGGGIQRHVVIGVINIFARGEMESDIRVSAGIHNECRMLAGHRNHCAFTHKEWEPVEGIYFRNL